MQSRPVRLLYDFMGIHVLHNVRVTEWNDTKYSSQPDISLLFLSSIPQRFHRTCVILHFHSQVGMGRQVSFLSPSYRELIKPLTRNVLVNKGRQRKKQKKNAPLSLPLSFSSMTCRGFIPHGIVKCQKCHPDNVVLFI